MSINDDRSPRNGSDGNARPHFQERTGAGVDANTAFETFSIDIADIDVGENIAARLLTDQAAADTRMARARAEARRADAITLQQEMKAQVEGFMPMSDVVIDTPSASREEREETASLVADLRALRCDRCKVAIHDELATGCPVCGSYFDSIVSNHAGLAKKLSEKRAAAGVRSCTAR